MLEVLVGQSEDVDEQEAIAEVLAQIQEGLQGRAPTAGILFCSVDLQHQEILGGLLRAFPDIELIGCTTDGEISSQCGFTDDSVALLVFVSDTIEMRAGIGRNVSSEGQAAGEAAAAACLAGLQRRNGEQQFAVILSDPLSAGTSGVDRGVKAQLGETFPVFGGVAAAHAKNRKTHQFYNGEVVSDSVVLLLFAGPVRYAFGIKGGHAPLGLREKVVASENNVLYRIGDSTAYDYFRRYVGAYDLFMNYCLAVYPDCSDEYFVLSAPSSDENEGLVRLNGFVPPQAEVQIGTANKEVIASSCAQSLDTAVRHFGGGEPAGALFFSCAGRKMIMGTKIGQESEIAAKRLPRTPFIGFYCYGEFGPPAAGEPYRFHGTTFVSLLIGEAQGEHC